MKNYVSYENATELMKEVGTKIKSLTGAMDFRGTVTFANLPSTLTEAMSGYVYNVSDEFTTDARFVEGAGKKFPAGTDVSVANLSTFDAVVSPAADPAAAGYYELVNGKYITTEDTSVESGKTYYEKTVDVKYNVGAGFIDVDTINSRITKNSNSMADAFDSTEAYAIGDVVVHEDGLYKFKAAHTADTDWDADEVDPVTIEELISSAEPDSLTQAQVTALLGLLD